MAEKKQIVHYVGSFGEWPACGLLEWEHDTDNTEDTTCKNCLRSIERKKREDEKKAHRWARGEE